MWFFNQKRRVREVVLQIAKGLADGTLVPDPPLAADPPLVFDAVNPQSQGDGQQAFSVIGGHDILIPTNGYAAALAACLRLIHHFWPDAVFENAEDGAGALGYESFAIGSSKEVFAYRDRAAADAWNEKGADPALLNTMVHVLFSDGTITLVVDDPDDPAIAVLLREIQSMFEMPMLRATGLGQGPYETFLPGPRSAAWRSHPWKGVPEDGLAGPSDVPTPLADSMAHV